MGRQSSYRRQPDLSRIAPAMSHITRTIVLCLGVSQLLCWGITYYLIGVFGPAMAGDLGFSLAWAHGGFTAALLVMGAASTAVGRAIDRWGGRPVMITGSLLSAAGCLGLSATTGIVSYYASWLVLGLAMRMSLYDAAFATLARLGGPQARRPISQITLLGGLAATVLWPVGQALADAFGWRGALVAYALIALGTVPLHAAMPSARFEAPAAPPPPPPPPDGVPAAAVQEPVRPPGSIGRDGLLYALITTLTSTLASALSAHMIGLLAGLGVATAAAVWISALRGVGQSAARLGEVLFGARLSPLNLGVIASALLTLGFLVGLFSAQATAAGVAFALLIGAGNGLLTIVRGTLPLVLFDPRTYGLTVGRLVAPSFYVSALAPLVYALVIERLGEAAALLLSVALGALTLGASLALRLERRG